MSESVDPEEDRLIVERLHSLGPRVDSDGWLQTPDGSWLRSAADMRDWLLR